MDPQHTSVSPALGRHCAYCQASNCRHKHSPLGVTFLSHGQGEPGSEPRSHNCKAWHLSNELLHCGDLYRFSQSLHMPLSLPPMENLALEPKSREERASVGQENQTPQLLPQSHSHPEALVFPAACYSLAIWTPVNSIHLHRGRGHSVKSSEPGPGPTAASTQ